MEIVSEPESVRAQLAKLGMNRELGYHRALIDGIDDELVGLLEEDGSGCDEEVVFDAVKAGLTYPDGEMRGFVKGALWTIWRHRKIGENRSLKVAGLLVDRFRITDEVGVYKMLIGRETYDPAREKEHTTDLCSRYLDRKRVIKDLYDRVYEYSRFRQDANRGLS